MDDNNLSITFDINLSEEFEKQIDLSKSIDISFDNMFIDDEEKNILYLNYGYSEKINEIIEERYGVNIFNKPDEYRMKLEESGLRKEVFNGNLNEFVVKKGKNTIKLVYNMNLVGQEKYFPRSKKLNFDIRDVKIEIDKENTLESRYLSLKGKWNFSVDLPEKIAKRKMHKYIQNECIRRK